MCKPTRYCHSEAPAVFAIHGRPCSALVCALVQAFLYAAGAQLARVAIVHHAEATCL